MPDGVDLVNPNLARQGADKKDYEKRKKAFLEDTSKLEMKYNLRYGAEIRANPVSIYAQLVVIDLKRMKKRSSGGNLPN